MVVVPFVFLETCPEKGTKTQTQVGIARGFLAQPVSHSAKGIPSYACHPPSAG